MEKILVGLDIGSKNIKAIQLDRQKTTPVLLAAGYIATPGGLVSAGAKEEQILANSINRLTHEMKLSTSAVCASLPTSGVITRIIEMPLLSESELESAITWEAEPYIPVPMANVKIDYCIVEKNEESKKMKILLVAAPIVIIEKYIRIIDLAGLKPVALETEIIAAARSVTRTLPTISNLLIITYGVKITEITLLHNSLLIYTKSFPFGSDTLVRSLVNELGFEEATAEEYFKTYGLDEDKLEGKISKVLMPFFNNLIIETEKTIGYFKELYPKEEISTLVLCGGGAKLPGLIMTLTKNLSLDSQISNPFTNIAVDPAVLPVLLPDAPLYTTAIGLAQKEI